MTSLVRANLLFNELNQISVSPPGVTRASFGALENAANEINRLVAQLIGLNYHTDSTDYLCVTLPGRNRHLLAIMTGSHLDNVPHGGDFDGRRAYFLDL